MPSVFLNLVGGNLLDAGPLPRLAGPVLFLARLALLTLLLCEFGCSLDESVELVLVRPIATVVASSVDSSHQAIALHPRDVTLNRPLVDTRRSGQRCFRREWQSVGDPPMLGNLHDDAEVDRINPERGLFLEDDRRQGGP